MSHTIALGSIFIECNHFGGVPADMETFRRTQLGYGDAVLRNDSGTVGGMLNVLRNRGVNIRPLLVASGCPSRHVTSGCFDELKGKLLQSLRNHLPVDGVLLALHGAAAAENTGDLEGDLLRSVRAIIGSDVPIVGTLDLHAHVTQQMVTEADALLAWETYPHMDAWQTGVRGATAMLDIIDGRLKPTMAMAKTPVLVSGVHGQTEGPGPFADVMRLAKSFEKLDQVYSTSAFLVHPYLDLPEMGGGGLVITNDDLALAKRLAGEIGEMYWQKRFELEPSVHTPAEAVQQGATTDGLVVLVETSDCCGGGAAGDSVWALRALLCDAEQRVAFVPVVDPQAAEACHQAGEGREITIELGHRLDSQWGSPLELTGRIIRLSNGEFQYRGGIWNGISGNMGRTAVLRVGGIHVVIATHATYEWCGEQFDAVGLDVSDAKFVVAKNPMNYHLAYGEVAKAIFVLDTPGPTPPTLKHVQYRNLQRPYFPKDEEIDNSGLHILSR